jgi:hypothetical protein
LARQAHAMVRARRIARTVAAPSPWTCADLSSRSRPRIESRQPISKAGVQTCADGTAGDGPAQVSWGRKRSPMTLCRWRENASGPPAGMQSGEGGWSALVPGWGGDGCIQPKQFEGQDRPAPRLIAPGSPPRRRLRVPTRSRKRCPPSPNRRSGLDQAHRGRRPRPGRCRPSPFQHGGAPRPRPARARRQAKHDDFSAQRSSQIKTGCCKVLPPYTIPRLP